MGKRREARKVREEIKREGKEGVIRDKEREGERGCEKRLRDGGDKERKCGKR